MHTWLLLALLAPALFTVVNFIDKYMLESKVKDYRGIPVFSSLMSFLFGTVYWLATGMQTLPLLDGVLVFGAGFISILGYFFYMHAISKSATSLIIALLQMTPVLTLLFSVLFLQDTITGQQFVGFVLVLLSVVAFSFKKEKKGMHMDSAFYSILLADCLFAIANILIKLALNANSFTQIFSYESWGLSVGGLCLFLFFKPARRAFFEILRTVGKSVIGIMATNELIFLCSKAASFLAIALGPVALVSVLNGIQVFYGILFGWILMLIAPKIFKEDISKEGLLKKIVLTSLLFLGIFLIT